MDRVLVAFNCFFLQWTDTICYRGGKAAHVCTLQVCERTFAGVKDHNTHRGWIGARALACQWHLTETCLHVLEVSSVGLQEVNDRGG